jgi:sporulation protein YlmC with PRC-barrel domain
MFHRVRRILMAKKFISRKTIAFVSAAATAVALVSPSVAQQKTATLPDGKIVYVSTVPGDNASVTTYYNHNVYNLAGEKLGEVNDLLLGPDHKVSTAVIGVGGFLGMGEKVVAVPFESLRVVRKDATWQLVMDATKDSLKAAPAFEHAADRTTVIPSRTSTPATPAMPEAGVPPTAPKQ